MSLSSEELEEQSFRNMVEYHREDLLQLMNGARLRDIFTQNQSQRLKRHGILQRGLGKNHVLPSPNAIAILEEQSSSGTET